MIPPTSGPPPGARLNHLPSPWPVIVPRRPPSPSPPQPTWPVPPIVEPPGQWPTLPLRADDAPIPTH